MTKVPCLRAGTRPCFAAGPAPTLLVWEQQPGAWEAHAAQQHLDLPAKMNMPSAVVRMSFIWPVTLVARGLFTSVHLRHWAGARTGLARQVVRQEILRG